ncbi:MAG TPA: asparagine synthase-related protein [Thermoplasmata archaeon]|nr:asparagine synthase-related protein [Thermoplasmata archaeon]
MSSDTSEEETRTGRAHAEAFLDAFHAAVRRLPDQVTVLYSGGLDSSLVAHCAQELGRTVRLSVLGIADAPDVRAAREGASVLGLPLEESILAAEEVPRALADPAFGPFPRTEPSRSVRLAFALAMRSATGPDLVCGQGADELFGGYAHFHGLTLADSEARRREDLARLVDEEWPWALGAAERLGRRAFAPFLDPSVRRRVLAIPPARTLAREPPKSWLRTVARNHGVPQLLTDRSKRALQYGSRVRQSVGPSIP